MSDPAVRVRAAVARLAAACSAVGRAPGGARLVAVAKTFSAEQVRAVVGAGCGAVGENYLQEARAKMAELAELPIEWHFVGAPQSNKAAEVARRFDWAHGLDSPRAAEKMSTAREAAGLPPMPVLLQVNIDREPGKSGAAPEDALALAREIAALPHLRLRGLTAIPAPDPHTRRAAFRRAAELRNDIAAALGMELPELSMGMSADLEDAVAEGATMVRLGEAIFGPRMKKEKQAPKESSQ